MVLPSLGGYFLDQRFKTGIVLTVVGLLFGFVMGFVQLVRLTNSNSKSK
jgi:F0F1-type ATP synthase assembly protein I